MKKKILYYIGIFGVLLLLAGYYIELFLLDHLGFSPTVEFYHTANIILWCYTIPLLFYIFFLFTLDEKDGKLLLSIKKLDKHYKKLYILEVFLFMVAILWFAFNCML